MSAVAEGEPMGFTVKSKAELDKDRQDQYPPLSEDTYLSEIESIDVNPQPNPYQKTKEYPEGEPRDVAIVKFIPLECANGDELVDYQDNDVPPEKRIRGFFDLSRVGFSKTGPSMARQFLAAITNV